MIDIRDIQKASERIEKNIHRTPMMGSATLSSICNNHIFLKTENLQKTGAFKIRGALNAVLALAAERDEKGIITASSGNHGQAVAFAGALAGHPATVVMPENASPAKIDAVKGYGARVILHGTSSKERIDRAEELCRERELAFIHPFNDPHVMAGQGTIGLEILEDMPDVEQVLVPIGGGGLISGIATAIKQTRPGIRVLGIEPEQSNSMYLSVKNGERRMLDKIVSMADGLKTTIPGTNTFPVVRKYVDDILLVSEKDIAKAVQFLLLRCKLLVEPSGAVTVAALMSGKVSPENRKTAAVLSGGNIAPGDIVKIISHNK